MILVDSVKHDYSGTNVTTGAWVELIASLAYDASFLDIYDSSTAQSVMEIGIGPSGGEVSVLKFPPGGREKAQCQFSKGQRISIRAVDSDATDGKLLINFHK